MPDQPPHSVKRRSRGARKRFRHYPREIEEFLYTHPDILDVQVIGVPDDRMGEEVMAWIQMRAGAVPLTAESLRSYCTGKLAHYKIPRYVHITDEFPMTVTGKIRKIAMRTTSLELLGLQQDADTAKEPAPWSNGSSITPAGAGHPGPARPAGGFVDVAAGRTLAGCGEAEQLRRPDRVDAVSSL
ncbi:AMP-binding enzyme [Streptomyces avermitilis]|uniref:AMP-binding enzyme n=1 Tax=Streptomyces avermitilis TaxID=33903 RepID=UPI00367D655E